MAKVIIVNAPGPQGPKGDQGEQGPPGSGTIDTGSFVNTSSFYAFTQSYYSDSASFVNAINNITIDTSSLVTTSSFNQFTSSYNTGSFSGSFVGTSSWTFNALTASLAPNYVLISVTSSMLEPYVLSSQTGSFILNSQTSSMTVLSSSYSLTASYLIGGVTIDTSSLVTTSSFNQFTQSYYLDSSSFDSRINNITFDTSSLVTTSSFNQFTSSYNTGSFSGSFIGTATTASYAIFSPYIITIGSRIYTDDVSITAGSKGYRHIGFNSNITKVVTLANTNGNITLELRRNGLLLGSASLANQSSSIDTTLTGWTKTLNTNDLIEFYVSQSSVYITDFSIFIDIQARP